MSPGNGWQRVTFGDVVRNVSESVADPVSAGLERAVGLEHLEPGELQVTRWASTTDGLTFTRRFRPGQLLFGRRRAYQRKVAITDFDGVCSGDIYVLEPRNERLIAGLLPFIVQSEPFFQHALRTSAGSLSPRTKWTDLKNYELDLPPLDEQREIASVLQAASELGDRLARLKGAAECTVAALRDVLFEPAHAPTVELRDVSAIPSQNGLTKVKKSRSGTARMVNMGQIFGLEEVDVPSAERVDLTPSERRSHLLAEGDMLFARRSIVLAGAGKCSIVPAIDQDVTFESSIIRVRIDRNQAEPRFLLHYFRSRWGREAMRRIVRPGPVAGIAGSDLRRIKVPVPEADEQRRVIDRIEAARAPLSTIALHARETRDLRNELIATLLNQA